MVASRGRSSALALVALSLSLAAAHPSVDSVHKLMEPAHPVRVALREHRVFWMASAGLASSRMRSASRARMCTCSRKSTIWDA